MLLTTGPRAGQSKKADQWDARDGGDSMLRQGTGAMAATATTGCFKELSVQGRRFSGKQSESGTDFGGQRSQVP